MSTVRVSATGQITIPAGLRRRLRIRSGTVLSIQEENSRLVLISLKRLLNEIRGSLKPRPGEPSMFEESLKERERGRIYEGS